ncbi:MAG TPA: hypothetical protein VGJ73_18965 [Verrucomicrobiae bacterium]|jgi:hypothetical protein
MRQLIGALLGFSVLLIGLITPIILLAGISGMIWGGKVFEGGMPKNSPAYMFGLFAMPPAMIVGAYFTLCLFVLPIFAKFDVRVASSGRGNMITGFARLTKTIAIYYIFLMEKLIDQEKRK